MSDNAQERAAPVINMRISASPNIRYRVLTEEQLRSIGIDPAIIQGRDAVSPTIGDNGNWWLWNWEDNQYHDSGHPAASPGGTADHNALIHRDMASQHPIGAITDLRNELDQRPKTVALTIQEIDNILV